MLGDMQQLDDSANFAFGGVLEMLPRIKRQCRPYPTQGNRGALSRKIPHEITCQIEEMADV